MELKLEYLVQHLQELRKKQGDEAYNFAAKAFFKTLVTKPSNQPVAQKLFDLLDGLTFNLEDLQKEVADLRSQKERVAEAHREEAQKVANAPDLQHAMMQALKKQMPNLKTQAEFNLVTQIFETLQIHINAALGQDEDTASKSREALNQALDLLPRLAIMAEEASASPEIPTNPDFTAPPKQYTEGDFQAQLLRDLDGFTSLEQLTQWYQANREVLDSQIVSKGLRDELFDRIRTRKKELTT